MLQLIETSEFFKLILDSITEHIVVLDQAGTIIFCNLAWIEFGRNNGYQYESWLGTNYISVCDNAAAAGDEYGKLASQGIKDVIGQKTNNFFLEYPCHSLDEKRWFMMRVTQLTWDNTSYIVITHQNITERKIAEEKVLNLSQLDGVTRIFNRKKFDEFIELEFRRCARLNLPLCLALIDIDHFKLLNDTYGHQQGDKSLSLIAEIMSKNVNRPSDLAARIGGDEFSYVLGNTGIEQALVLVNKLIDDIHELKIPNEKSPVFPIVTVSIGLAMIYPNKESNTKDLINIVDRRLYSAKESGKNCIVYK